MALSVYAKNKSLDALVPDQISIHTANPTDDGSVGELSGGSYARQAISFAAASAGSRAMTGQVTVSIPAGSNISHYALWESGTCIDFGDLENVENYTGEGEYKLTSFTITNT